MDDQSAEQVRLNRGTLTAPGVDSPYRNRPVDENLDLFRRMRQGEFPDGSRVLRAKIDMASPNILMRDPTLYRILRHHHHRTGDKWCIYPMYDFQHPLQDALEGITHSLCSLEYEIHRPLYDWVVREAGFAHPPRQIEFARLNLTRTVMSKRHLRRLVEEGRVGGWDDPRMPTLAGMRRRGYPPEAIQDFLARVGVSKADSTVDGALLEHCVREALGESAPWAMAVLNPVEVILTNWPEGKVDHLQMENHPDHPEMGARSVRFTGRLFIEREDFLENPPPKFFRLAPAARRGSRAPTSSGVMGSKKTKTARFQGFCVMWIWIPLRQRGRQPQGQGHAALAEGSGRPPLRGSAVRADPRRGRAAGGNRLGRGGRRCRKTFQGLHGPPQPQQPDRHGKSAVRAGRRGSPRRRALPVPAHGLFRQGPVFVRRKAGLQPRRIPQGRLAEGQKR